MGPTGKLLKLLCRQVKGVKKIHRRAVIDGSALVTEPQFATQQHTNHSQCPVGQTGDHPVFQETCFHVEIGLEWGVQNLPKHYGWFQTEVGAIKCKVVASQEDVVIKNSIPTLSRHYDIVESRANHIDKGESPERILVLAKATKNAYGRIEFVASVHGGFDDIIADLVKVLAKDIVTNTHLVEFERKAGGEFGIIAYIKPESGIHTRPESGHTGSTFGNHPDAKTKYIPDGTIVLDPHRLGGIRETGPLGACIEQDLVNVVESCGGGVDQYWIKVVVGKDGFVLRPE